MKTRYIFSGPLMMISIHLSMIRVDIAGSAPNFVWVLLTFLSCICTFFSIKWFMNMVWAVKELEEKVEWHEKRLDKHKDDIVHLDSKTDRIEYKLDEVEDESRRAF